MPCKRSFFCSDVYINMRVNGTLSSSTNVSSHDFHWLIVSLMVQGETLSLTTPMALWMRHQCQKKFPVFLPSSAGSNLFLAGIPAGKIAFNQLLSCAGNAAFQHIFFGLLATKERVCIFSLFGRLTFWSTCSDGVQPQAMRRATLTARNRTWCWKEWAPFLAQHLNIWHISKTKNVQNNNTRASEIYVLYFLCQVFFLWHGASKPNLIMV